MIWVSDLSVHAGRFRLERVSFEISTGEYGVLMGKTGSGKTTLLEAIAGLKPVASGKITLDGRDVTRLKPSERNMGYVPQDGALFTTMSVRDHLAFALFIRRASRKEIEQRVGELAELLGIQHLLERSTLGLSGGEKQRVAIGRALSFRPSTLLLDEPLSAIDDGTRQQMYVLLEHVRRHTGATTLHVTHNVNEATRLADRLFRLDGGRVVQRSLSDPGNGATDREINDSGSTTSEHRLLASPSPRGPLPK